MNRSTRTLCFATALAAVLFQSTSGQAAEPNAPVETGPYELKKKSSFSLSTDKRAPFWPIGWVKRSKTRSAEVAAVPRSKIDENAFKVSSILVGNPSLAVINARAYSEGELVRMPKGSNVGRVRVQQINDGSVTLENEGQMLVIPMRRQEFAARKGEELLLDEDR